MVIADPIAGAGSSVLPEADQADPQSRIRGIRKPKFVDYGIGDSILDRFEWLFDYPKVPRPPCSLIFGDTNNGKTALAHKFLRAHAPSEEDPDHGKQPVLYVIAPPFADVGGFYDSALRALNAPFRSTARAQAKWDQLLQMLNAVGTRMLIVDEVNNLLVGKVDQRAMVLNSLKSLSNELKIPVVAMGTQDAVRIFQTDQQLGNRFQPFGIPRWSMSREYALFVARYVQSLGLKQESDFRSKELVRRIHSMSEGLIGETCKLLGLAAEMAIQSGREIIDAETLDQVRWVMPSERRRIAR